MTHSIKPAASRTTKPAASRTTKPAASRTTKPAASRTTKPAASRTTPLSGSQHEISAAGYTATIASVGAALRTLRYEGRDLVVPFGADEVRPASRGIILVPWPNRINNGRYTFDGVDYQTEMTEPKRFNALHGFGGWEDWTLLEHDESAAVLGIHLQAREGYPFRVFVTVAYRLSSDGLHTSVTATNTGQLRAPYGTAPHPYLVAGGGLVDDWTLDFAAREVMEVDDRLIPTTMADVRGTEFDFSAPKQIASTFIDHAFRGFDPRPSDGLVELRLHSAEGTGVAMVWDEEVCPWVQLHTADQPIASLNRVGLAVEPMTCPPDAFNSGTDLIVLEPGQSHEAWWRIKTL